MLPYVSSLEVRCIIRLPRRMISPLNNCIFRRLTELPVWVDSEIMQRNTRNFCYPLVSGRHGTAILLLENFCKRPEADIGGLEINAHNSVD